MTCKTILNWETFAPRSFGTFAVKIMFLDNEYPRVTEEWKEADHFQLEPFMVF